MRPTFDEIKNEALRKLDKKWGNTVLAILVVGIISAIASIIPFGALATAGPFALGMAIYFIKISRDESVDLNNIFDGFKNFGNAIGAYILILIVVFIGFILLIVPGIIAALALSQTYRIMKDNPTMGITEAMQKSHEMMKGHRGDYFLFNLSFIGWAFLCIFTLGLGFLILAPYVSTSNAIYYNYLVGYQDKQIDEIGSELLE
jgi:uncharacterized membrane protein